MYKRTILVLIFLMAGFALSLLFRINQMSFSFINQISNMKLTSPAFAEGGKIPDKYTCKGANINPPLAIKDIPAGTQSLAIVLEDPDAPVQTFYHWLIWNISPQTIVIIEDTVPGESVQGTNSYGKQFYGGPCPPVGSHRYVFKLFALDTILTLPREAGIREFEQVIEGHVLGQTELVGIYP